MADHVKEYAHHKKISSALATGFYFAHPYPSWEQGLKGNTHGVLR